MKTSKVLAVGENDIMVEEATAVVIKDVPYGNHILIGLSIGDWVEYNDTVGEYPTLRQVNEPGVLLPVRTPPLLPAPRSVLLRSFFTLEGAHPEQTEGHLLGYQVVIEFDNNKLIVVHSETFYEQAKEVAYKVAQELYVPVVSAKTIHFVELRTVEATGFSDSRLPQPDPGTAKTLPSGRTLLG